MRALGINIGLLDRGTRILVATEATEFEMVVVEPHQSLVDVSANDPRFQPPRLGRLIGSSSDIGGERMKHDWIGPGLYLNIRFRNITFVTNPIVKARIEGVGQQSGRAYHYDVF